MHAWLITLPTTLASYKLRTIGALRSSTKPLRAFAWQHNRNQSNLRRNITGFDSLLCCCTRFSLLTRPCTEFGTCAMASRRRNQLANILARPLLERSLRWAPIDRVSYCCAPASIAGFSWVQMLRLVDVLAACKHDK